MQFSTRFDSELTATLDFFLDGRYLSSEDSKFIEIVAVDVNDFLKKSSVERVLLFPPVNSYHRLLIHKVVEDFSEVRSFSVGEGSDRRTVVCLQNSLRRGPKGIELMSSSENLSVGRGRGRGRLSRNKGSPSPHGGSSLLSGSGDGASLPVSEHVAPCADTARTDGDKGNASAMGHYQETRKCETVTTADSKRSLTARYRTKKKKPEIQVYVPRAKRLQQQQQQQQQHQEEDDSAEKDDSELVNTTSSHLAVLDTQQNTEEHLNGDVCSRANKPVSTRRKTRPEMQRYVPRGKREIITLVPDNCASSSLSEKESDFKTERTETLSSRTRPTKKLKTAENSSEFSSAVENRENIVSDFTSNLGCNEDSVLDVNIGDTYLDRPMEVESWDDVQETGTACQDFNISHDSYNKQFSDSDNDDMFEISHSNIESSASKLNLKCDPVSKEIEASDHLLNPDNISTIDSINFEHDSVDNTVCTNSTSDLICDTPSMSDMMPIETCTSISSPVNSANVSCIDFKEDAVSLCIDSVPSYSEEELSAEDNSDQTAHIADGNPCESNSRESVDHHICNIVEMAVASNPDICPVEARKKMESLESDLNPVDSEQYSYTCQGYESSLDDSCCGNIPDLEDTCNLSSCSTNKEIIAKTSQSLSAVTGSSEDSESQRQVTNSRSLPDVVASTMDPKAHHRPGGGILTSIALRQLETATDHRPLPSDELMNSKVDADLEEEGDSESEDEDGWDTMFDDNGDCLDPSIMEELTSHVGNVKIDKPKINYLKFETKDPDVDMEAYNHVIEIFDFPSEFTTRDLIGVFKDFMARGFDIKWVDDTHALGVFANTIAARDALAMVSPFLKVRQLSEASKQSKMKAKKSTEFLQPYKARPQTSAVTARRMVSGALGIQASIPREKREQERKLLKEAKEKRKQARQQKQDIWDGSFGKCAMDDT